MKNTLRKTIIMALIPTMIIGVVNARPPDGGLPPPPSHTYTGVVLSSISVAGPLTLTPQSITKNSLQGCINAVNYYLSIDPFSSIESACSQDD